MPDENENGEHRHNRVDPVASLRDKIEMRRTIAGEAISLASLLGRPVLASNGTRVGRVSDVVVNWEAGTIHPRVSGVLATVGKDVVFVDASQVALGQTKVDLLSTEILAAHPVRSEGDIALARDVLDHQLVDIEGVQVVRAADVYLTRLSDGWELAGVDVGFWSLARRVLVRRRECPPPHRAIDWADLQTFVPSEASAASTRPTEPAAAAGAMGSGIQLGSPAKDLHRLHAKEVAAILSDLGRREQAQMAKLVAPSAAALVLRELSQENRDALLAELSDDDRERLLALLRGDAR